MIIAPDNITTKIRQATGGLSSSDSSDIRNLGVIFDRSMCLNSHGKSVVHVFSILGTLRRSDLWFQKRDGDACSCIYR